MGSDGIVLRVAHAGPSRKKLSPLVRGIGYRLGWAAGLSALLWLAVFWALS